MTAPPRGAGWRGLIAAVLVLLAIGAGLAAVFHAATAPSKAGDEDEAEGANNPPPRVTVKNGVAVLTLSAADQQNSGIATARAGTPPAQRAVAGYATVLDAAPLTDLSNRYLDAEAQLQGADAKLAVSRAAFARAKILYKDRQNMSAAQLQGAEGSFAVDTAALAAARSRLATLTASAQQAWGSVLGAALIDHAPLIAGLIGRRRYLVKVTLPPGVAIAAPPPTATTRLPGGKEVTLAYLSPATTADPQLQGISYFYSAPAEDGLLPGFNLEVSLPVPRGEPGSVVPESAVVWLQGKAWIYLRTGPTTFVRRAIAPDRPAANGGYVVAGLPADAQIVVRGAQMLLSEEFRAQVPVED